MVYESKPSLAQHAGLLQASREAVSQAFVPLVSTGSSWLQQTRDVLRNTLASLLPDRPGRLLRAPDEIELLRVAVAAAHERISLLESQIASLDARLKAHVSGSRAAQTLQITTRGQILKMARTGRQPEQISEALGVPRGEVILLLGLQLRQLSISSKNAKNLARA